MEDRFLIFMHIPKTGGSTLNSIFRQQYKKGELLDHTPIETIRHIQTGGGNAIKGISGHHQFGIHHWLDKPYTYFSMVRHPVERVVSLYYYLASTPKCINYQTVKNMTIEEFIIRFIKAKNYQTSYFTGENEVNIERATRNMTNYFPIVGVTEMFNESVFLLKKQFGWENIVYTKLNVTEKRPMLKDIPISTIKLIEKNNRMDIELYNFARERLQKQVDSLTYAEKMELDNYIKVVLGKK